MKLRFFILFLFVSWMTTGCSRSMVEAVYDVNYKPTNRFAKNLAPLPGQFEKDPSSLNGIIHTFKGDIKNHWGEEEVYFAGNKNYVKYTDNYLSRAQIDFANGMLRIETVATSSPKDHLHKAIVTTLLTPSDPASVDLYSAADVATKGQPFLQGQVVDHEGKEIGWEWRANRFADYLIKNKLKTKSHRLQKIFYVDIPMVKNHALKRRHQYAKYISEAAKRYSISEELIYAIIKTESSFNPYAVSSSNAYGLMQIIPNTAGRDVFRLIKNRTDDPTPAYLFDPARNIDMGAAYIYLLKNRYLNEVRDPLSQHYSIISAYNGGAGNVFRTFHHSDRLQAMNKLNTLRPNQVFQALTHKHPSSESRRYLQKVTTFQQEFSTL